LEAARADVANIVVLQNAGINVVLGEQTVPPALEYAERACIFGASPWAIEAR